MTGSGDPPGSGDGGPKHIDDGQVEIPEPEPESSGVPAPAVPGTDTTRSFRPRRAVSARATPSEAAGSRCSSAGAGGCERAGKTPDRWRRDPVACAVSW